LGDTGLQFMKTFPGSEPVYHHFTVQLDRRDEVAKKLKGEGIGTGIHYPIPLYLQPALRRLALREGSFPVAESLARRTLSLPLYPELTEQDVGVICRVLRTFI
jgi:dTDP-4-amino-4,6-dideoxygalactose transaminase